MNAVFSRFFIPSGNGRFYGALTLFVTTFLLTSLTGMHPAMALGATSLGDVFCIATANLSPFLDVFNMIAYTAGGIFIIQALLHLRHHPENPTQHPHFKTMAHFIAGSALLTLPSITGTLIETLFVVGGDGLIGSCSVKGNKGSGALPLDVMMTNFVNNIQAPLTLIVSVSAIALGVFLIVRGLMKAAKYGTDPKAHSMTVILSNLIIGTVLIVIGESVDAVMGSILGVTAAGGGLLTFNSLAWTSLNSLGDVSHFKAAMQAALTFFQLVGFISFVRGWNVIRNAVEGVGQATVTQGFTHIVGGVLAINIYFFMEIMDYTFGTQFVT